MREWNAGNWELAALDVKNYAKKHESPHVFLTVERMKEFRWILSLRK